MKKRYFVFAIIKIIMCFLYFIIGFSFKEIISNGIAIILITLLTTIISILGFAWCLNTEHEIQNKYKESQI